MEFTSRDGLRKHVKSIHEWVRFACDFVDTQKGNLTRHVRAVHEKLKDYQCVLCHLFFSQTHNLDRHIAALHDKIRNFVCEVCRKTFTRLNSLHRHEKKQHLIRMIKGFEDDDNLTYYGRPRLLQIEQPELYRSALALATASSIVKQYECNQCDKSYETKQSLQQHIEAIHLAIRYRCENYPSTFNRKGNLAAHLRRTCARKPLKCSMSKALSEVRLVCRASTVAYQD